MASGKQKPFSFRQSATEAQLHQSAAELLEWMLIPPAFFTTFPAGWGKLSKGTAGRLFAAGLKKGMPDILVFGEYRKVVGIELKAGRGTPSSAQRDMAARLKAVGIDVYVCYSLEDVMFAMRDNCILCRDARLWKVVDGTELELAG